MESPTTASAADDLPVLGLGSLSTIPEEMLSRILFFSLRPDCTETRQCNKDHEHNNGSSRCDILVVSSEFYNRSLPLLQSSQERIMKVSFRKDFPPHPKNLWPYTIPCFNITVELPSPCYEITWKYSDLSPKLLRQLDGLKDLIRVLRTRKTSIRSLALHFFRKKPKHYPRYLKVLHKEPISARLASERDNLLGIPDVLLELVTAIKAKGGQVAVGRKCLPNDAETDDDEPMIALLRATALQHGVTIDHLPQPTGNNSVVMNPADSNASGSNGLVYGIIEKDVKTVNGLAGRRVLIPECQSCRKTFHSEAALHWHMEGRCNRSVWNGLTRRL